MVENWIHEWFDAHMGLFPMPMPPWPELGSENFDALVEGFRSNFVRAGVLDLAIAREASQRLMAQPCKFRDGHLPGLLALAREIYRERGAESGTDGATSSRELAANASWDCEHCCGNGLAVVYHCESTHANLAYIEGGQRDRRRPIPPEVSAYCVCQLGRWIEANHRATAKDMHRRIPDFADVLAGRSVWLARPPQPDDQPAPEPERFDRSRINEMFAAHKIPDAVVQEQPAF